MGDKIHFFDQESFQLRDSGVSTIHRLRSRHPDKGAGPKVRTVVHLDGEVAHRRLERASRSGGSDDLVDVYPTLPRSTPSELYLTAHTPLFRSPKVMPQVRTLPTFHA